MPKAPQPTTGRAGIQSPSHPRVSRCVPLPPRRPRCAGEGGSPRGQERWPVRLSGTSTKPPEHLAGAGRPWTVGPAVGEGVTKSKARPCPWGSCWAGASGRGAPGQPSQGPPHHHFPAESSPGSPEPRGAGAGWLAGWRLSLLPALHTHARSCTPIHAHSQPPLSTTTSFLKPRSASCNLAPRSPPRPTRGFWVRSELPGLFTCVSLPRSCLPYLCGP